MANVDALLELGDQDEALSPPPANREQRESSDLFVVHTRDEEENMEEDRESGEEYRDEDEEEGDGKSGEQLSTSLDEFDPFSTTETVETVETFSSGEVVRTVVVTKTSKLSSSNSQNSDSEQQNDESQFDDLLGGLATDTMTTTSGMAANAVSWEDMEATDQVDVVAHTPTASPCTESSPVLVPDLNITNTSQSSPSVSPELSELMQSTTDAFDDGQMESFPDTVAPRAESEDLNTEDYLLSPSSELGRDSHIADISGNNTIEIPDVATTNGIVSPESNTVDGGDVPATDRYRVDTRPTPQMWESNVTPVTGENLCRVCQKRVYEMEKVIADEVIYHKTCFKCNHCKRVLSLGNFASISGQLLCKPHFMELFKTKDDESAKQKTPSPSAAVEVDGYRNQPEVFHFSETEDQVNQDQEIAHESREKEEIHFTEMSSVRTRFEDISHNAPPIFPNPVSPKRMSKRDEPKEASPPSPISHPEDIHVAYEVMSPDSTRHLIAKFANKEEDGEMTSPPPMSPRWKPVHRITPPRDLLRESIEDAQINGTSDAEEEEDQEEFNPDIVKSSNEYVIPEELPVPEKTRSILAKFRSMEDVNAPPLSPTKSVKKPFAMPPESSHSAPNLGAADTVVVNGNDDVDIQPEVIRPDGQEKYLEGEFPEYGLTKNLLARWRTLEQQNEKKAVFPTTPKLQKRQSDPACVFHQKEPVEVVRMSATDDEGETGGREECLPAHCYTRNILSKFQSMEVQAETKTPKKEYKWTVKEPKLLLRPGSAKSQSSSSTGGDTDHHIDDSSDVDQQDANEIEDVSNHQDGEEESDGSLLPIAHTRDLLAKFRQMEDSSIPPPSPERSTRIQKAAVQQVSVRKAAVAPSISNGNGMNIDEDEYDGRLSAEFAQNNMEPEAGEFENDPQHNPDVVRGDERIAEPLPEQGTTRNLLAKFQALQSTY